MEEMIYEYTTLILSCSYRLLLQIYYGIIVNLVISVVHGGMAMDLED